MKHQLFNFHTSPYQLFFEEEPDYELIKEKIAVLDDLMKMTHQNLCIIDFYKNNYFYISPNHFLAYYYNVEEAREEGEKFIEKIIYEPDKNEQYLLKNAMFSFFKTEEKAVVQKAIVFSSHRLIYKNQIITISNQYKPYLFDSHNNLWMVFCNSTFSTKNASIESYIEIEGTEIKYKFDVQKEKFILSKKKKLSEKESEVLNLTLQGYTSKEIAEKKFISLSTVKFHKQNILKKLHVQNISEAILYAHTHNLL